MARSTPNRSTCRACLGEVSLNYWQHYLGPIELPSTAGRVAAPSVLSRRIRPVPAGERIGARVRVHRCRGRHHWQSGGAHLHHPPDGRSRTHASTFASIALATRSASGTAQVTSGESGGAVKLGA